MFLFIFCLAVIRRALTTLSSHNNAQEMTIASGQQEHYLEMSVQDIAFPPPESNSYNNQNELMTPNLQSYEEPSCRSDDAVTVQPHSSSCDTKSERCEMTKLHGWIHILRHPIYQVGACPILL